MRPTSIFAISRDAAFYVPLGTLGPGQLFLLLSQKASDERLLMMVRATSPYHSQARCLSYS